MSVNIFVIIIDWIASVFVTIYNVIRNLGLSFIEYLLILFVILLACRLLAVVFGRLRLGRDLRRMLRKKGIALEKKHALFRSLFYRIKPYAEEDFCFTVGARRYHVKVAPGVVKGWRVIFDEDRTVILSRLFFRKKFVLAPIPGAPLPQKEPSRAMGRPAFADDPENEYILLFSPAPRGFYEAVRMHGGYDRFPLEGGNRFEETVFCEQPLFLRQLDRILDGYVDSFLFENQKNEEE